MSDWSMRARLGSGLAGLVLLSLCLRGLERPPAQLGRPRTCAQAQLVDGLLRCDEERFVSSSQLCAQGPAHVLRPGDAVELAQLCTGMAPQRMPPAQLRALAQPVEINEASIDELASLPGIGPKIAARIVARRPYRSVEELLEVRGIGPKRLAAVRARARVRTQLSPGR